MIGVDDKVEAPIRNAHKAKLASNLTATQLRCQEEVILQCGVDSLKLLGSYHLKPCHVSKESSISSRLQVSDSLTCSKEDISIFSSLVLHSRTLKGFVTLDDFRLKTFTVTALVILALLFSHHVALT